MKLTLQVLRASPPWLVSSSVPSKAPLHWLLSCSATAMGWAESTGIAGSGAVGSGAVRSGATGSGCGKGCGRGRGFGQTGGGTTPVLPGSRSTPSRSKRPSPPTIASNRSPEAAAISAKLRPSSQNAAAASTRLSLSPVASLERSQNITPPSPCSRAQALLSATVAGVSKELKICCCGCQR